jgi:hypothetical protein
MAVFYYKNLIESLECNAKFTDINTKNSLALVRERTIPIERQPLVGKVSANVW